MCIQTHNGFILLHPVHYLGWS